MSDDTSRNTGSNASGLIEPAIVASPAAELVRVQKRLNRERLVRQETEAIAEKALAELYVKQRDLQARQEELGLIQAITVAANEADTLEDALGEALTLVCQHTKWPVGHAWRINAENTRATSTKIWNVAGPDRFHDFRFAAEQTVFEKGSGLPGMVLASGKAAWIESLADSDNFPRGAICPDPGLNAGLAFPVVTGAQVVAVLEFFSEEICAPNPALLEVLSHVGTQLGRVVERECAREAMRWQAYHDALTSLPNRSLFNDRLTQALAFAERHGQSAAILFLDLDRFKHVNDTLGHSAGDRMLQEVSRRLLPCLGAEDTLARMGGDEFTVLLPGISHAEHALKVAQDLLAALSLPMVIDDRQLFISGSIGISLFPNDGQDSETLLRHADISMYRCKEQGGGCRLYTQEMDIAARERLTLESQLRHAIDREELVVFYQPQTETTSERTIGFEALVRWRHPTLGLVPPSRFIPLAEETGLILPLGQWVLTEATRQAAQWRKEGHAMRIAVNLSARQFEQRDLLGSVELALAQSGLPPDALEIEITESVLMAQGDNVVGTLNALKNLGVRLAVDDFGTGYSSLAYLRHFAVDVLKIDRTFVRGLACAEVDVAIVRAVIDLAHAIGLEVVAEGVETAEQRAILAGLGCDILQGYLISRPVPGGDAGHLLQAAVSKACPTLQLLAA